MRSREVFFGTVGGRIAATQRPRSNKNCESFSARAASPSSSGWIGVSESASAMPSCRAGAEAAHIGQQLRAAFRLGADDAQGAARSRGDRRWRRGGEHPAARTLDQEFDQLLVAGDEGAGRAQRLAERGDVHVRHHAGIFQRATAVGTEDAEAVRVVDHQRGVVLRGQRRQLAQRREVTVHAEHAVADDQPQPCRGGALVRQRRGEAGEIGMRDARVLRTGQATTVDQRGVVEFVGDQQIVAAQQRAQHAEVGRPAGGEQQHARPLHEVGELFFQLPVLAVVAGHQRRGAAAGAVGQGRTGGFGQPRVGGQAQVVVAAEIDAAAPGDLQMRAMAAVDRPADAVEIGLADPCQLGAQVRAEPGAADIAAHVQLPQPACS